MKTKTWNQIEKNLTYDDLCLLTNIDTDIDTDTDDINQYVLEHQEGIMGAINDLINDDQIALHPELLAHVCEE